ncbi:coiled-coil domain containing 92Bb [Denticeps clupeoides]|uniref:CCDC92/74 N-terminal domain-containing protein n=1 Tax=Denticeps clupeoides TaxID=299321 RepID=A0AAY4A9L5_9TELE|nr:coiled-coil domain-containing protein 92-like [Denticeps clupeoides]XP_028840061.1 coiled-coil domain-containing protein 92-like [Denticeps clupeoides]XP_028840063.1 coiled-coil domain-containing protein 92-like [Denticeps clupeoides]
MDTCALVQQVDSVDRSVAFLRQEHMLLIGGLQLEILHLKKRCAELSCEVNDRPPGRTQAAVDDECERLEARMQDMQTRLAARTCGVGGLRFELQRRATLASALQGRLRDEERRFLEELKRRGHKITALTRQLQQQTDTAAQLSLQLHNARFRLYHQHQDDGEEEDDEDEEELSEEGSQDSDWSLSAQASPEEVEEMQQSSVSVRCKRTEKVRECVPRERVLGPEEPRPMPDPALFLYPFRHRLLPSHTSLERLNREGDQSEGRRSRSRIPSPRSRVEPDTTEL